MSGRDWPPAADQFYLPADPARPLFQGDVYRDVPFVKAAFNSTPERPPNAVTERRTVAVLGHPCDLYQAGRPVRVQTVAAVLEAARIGLPTDWAGAYTYAPLPDLHGDGVTHAVALQAAGNIDARYLTRDRRVAALSRLGWAVFRHRLALCYTRALLRLDELDAAGAAVWAELELWTRWVAAGRAEADFAGWLDQAEPELGGFTRRLALERGLVPSVSVALIAELAARR